jgi:hypothetical protein
MRKTSEVFSVVSVREAAVESVATGFGAPALGCRTGEAPRVHHGLGTGVRGPSSDNAYIDREESAVLSRAAAEGFSAKGSWP